MMYTVLGDVYRNTPVFSVANLLGCLRFCSWRHTLGDSWRSNICSTSLVADWLTHLSVMIHGEPPKAAAQIPPVTPVCHPTQSAFIPGETFIQNSLLLQLCSQTSSFLHRKLWIFPLHGRGTRLSQLGFVTQSWVLPGPHLSPWSVYTPFYPTAS